MKKEKSNKLIKIDYGEKDILSVVKYVSNLGLYSNKPDFEYISNYHRYLCGELTILNYKSEEKLNKNFLLTNTISRLMDKKKINSYDIALKFIEEDNNHIKSLLKKIILNTSRKFKSKKQKKFLFWKMNSFSFGEKVKISFYKDNIDESEKNKTLINKKTISDYSDCKLNKQNETINQTKSYSVNQISLSNVSFSNTNKINSVLIEEPKPFKDELTPIKLKFDLMNFTSNKFLETKELKIFRLIRSKNIDEMKECTFKPNLISKKIKYRSKSQMVDDKLRKIEQDLNISINKEDKKLEIQYIDNKPLLKELKEGFIHINKLANKSKCNLIRSKSKNDSYFPVTRSKLTSLKSNTNSLDSINNQIKPNQTVLESLFYSKVDGSNFETKIKNNNDIMRKVNINHLDKQKLQQSLTSYCSEVFSNALIKSNLDSSRKSANSHRNIEIDNKSKIEKLEKVNDDNNDNHPNIKVAKNNFLMESLSDGFLKEIVNKRIETDESLENFQKKFGNENKSIKNSFIKSSDKFKDKRIQKALRYYNGYNDEAENKKKPIKVSK